MADDLRHWLAQEKEAAGLVPPPPSTGSRLGGRDPWRHPQGATVVQAEDADYFLRLLPGPRDRDGTPESLRFWKIKLDVRSPKRRSAPEWSTVRRAVASPHSPRRG